MKQNNPLSAMVAALLDRLKTGGKPETIGQLKDSDRLDGLTALVTGSSRGLGKAIATDLARRGASVIVASRSGVAEATQAIADSTGNTDVRAETVDLSDPDSIDNFCDRLRDNDVRLDIAVFNAGVMPRKSRRTAEGFEQMFAVNYLAKPRLVSRLLADGVIPKEGDGRQPRVVFVSSESHRTASELDFEALGVFKSYGIVSGMGHYGYSKLLLNTYAAELSRRLEGQVAVHWLCPGAIDSSISREAPFLIKPPLRLVMKLTFPSPEKAAVPVVYLACSPDLEGQTGIYLHTNRRRTPREDTLEVENGRQLWEATAKLMANGPPVDRGNA